MIMELNGSNAIQRRYVHAVGVDTPAMWYEGSSVSSSTRRSLIKDRQGSIIGVTDANGVSLSVNTYDAYGIPNSGNLGRFSYTGQAYLPEIGLMYYKARIYAPKLGRFLQTDPIGYEDQMNLYTYVGNDPMNMSDPTGMYGSVYGYMNAVNNNRKLRESDPVAYRAAQKQAMPFVLALYAAPVAAAGCVMGGCQAAGAAILSRAPQLTSATEIGAGFVPGMEAAGGGSIIALGLAGKLDDFASSVGGQTWKTWPGAGDDFWGAFHSIVGKPDTQIHFSLDGIDSVGGALSRAAANSPTASVTDRELLAIVSNSDAMSRTTFHLGDEVVDISDQIPPSLR